MHNIIINGTPSSFGKTWVCYTLRDGQTAEVMYNGHCRLTELFAMPDARANILFDECFPPDRPLLLCMVSEHPDRAHAALAARNLPAGRMNRADGMRRHAMIECVETGEKWHSAMDACRAHGLPQPALSNHLNGKPGYNSVKGRTYRRVRYA